MMSESRTRGMGPIAEAGELPQSKQYGTTSARSTNNETSSDNNEQSQFYVAPPKVSLPKSGGIVSGVGEKFNANPFTGTANVSIPVKVTPGRGGFQPDLTLSYSSGGGNGIFGMGWSLSLPAITRKSDKQLPQYFDDIDSDTFILAGAEDLVPKSGADAKVPNAQDTDSNEYSVKRYIPRVEQSFSLIEKWTMENGDVHWRTISKDNVTAIYGKDLNSRIADPVKTSRVFSWLLCELRDGKGNLIRYEYKTEDEVGIENRIEYQQPANSKKYIKTIYYGNQKPDIFGEKSTTDHHWYFNVEFDYADHELIEDTTTHHWSHTNGHPWHYREDAFSNYRSGFEVRTRRRCNRILMFHHFPEELDDSGNQVEAAEEDGNEFLVASTDFTYSDYSDDTPYTLITAASHCSFKKQTNNSYLKECLPPVNYEYSIPQVASQQSYLNPSSLENLPEGLAQGKYQLVDLDGVGVPGIITDQAGHWYYKEGLAEDGFGAMHPLPTKPSPGSLNGGQQLQDLDGDGLVSVVSYKEPLPGYFERSKDKNWKPFTNFKSLPNIDWQDPNLQMLDLNGDGYADILISQEQKFIWYPSKGREGFDAPRYWTKPQDEQKGPALVFSDITGSIYITDMSGDGLQDIARIRNGNVCYWPNLGYGRFGGQRQLVNAPVFDSQEQFNPQRLKLADIDGSGTTDFLYLGSETAYWLNLSGNRFSSKKTIEVFPATDNLTSVQLADIQANGTSCLVWSSSLPQDVNTPLKYVSLMESSQRRWNSSTQQYDSEKIISKPYLLTAIENNMGARTEVSYKPSTHYYLDDKKAGIEWQTRLPMAIQLVDSVKLIDLITNTVYTNQYKYHHGYFDSIEREFRGFGCVEQIDIDDFNNDSQLDQPPILSKTWFHTGAWLEAQQLENYFRKNEYYQGDIDAWYLPDTQFKDELQFTEQREAARVLKGSVLHQEVYAIELDNNIRTEKSLQPYSVSEQSYQIAKMQDKGGNPYSVFILQPLETLSYHYERDTNVDKDPRITHEINLEFDAKYNNVLRSASIVYPRRTTHQVAEYDKEQNKLRVIYSRNWITEKTPLESDYLTDRIAYRHSVAYKAKSWELCNVDNAGIKLEANSLPITDAELDAVINITFFDTNLTSQRKRLLSNTYNIFWNDQLDDVLPLEHVSYQALPHHNERLSINEEIIDHAFNDKLTNVERNTLKSELVSNTVGYIEKANTETNNKEYWQSSGVQYVDAGKFYLPIKVVDPFGNETVIENYWRNLIATKVKDPINNRVTVEDINPYHLQPTKIIDPNDNIDEAKLDILGQVIATARYGTQTNPENNAVTLVGNSLVNLPAASGLEKILFDDPTIDIPTEVTNALHHASSRIFIDFWRYYREQKPIAVLTASREEFSRQNPTSNKVQISVAYQDGLGRALVSKMRVDGGEAKQLDNMGAIETVNVTHRWLASGRVIYNNKGKPVKQFETYFSTTHQRVIEDEMLWGVSSTLFYDPLDRVIRTELPDGTFTKIEFTPWWQKEYDQNDTVLESDWYNININLSEIPNATTPQEKLNNANKKAAELAAIHANTPTETHLDNLARPFLVIENNGTEGKYSTKSKQDIAGNTLSIINAKTHTIIKSDYDYLGNPLRSNSVDSGDKNSVTNVLGNPYKSWDAKDAINWSENDVLQRPVALFVREKNKPQKCIQYIVYGDHNDITDAKDKNLRGAAYLVADGAGSIKTTAIDILGNPLENLRQIVNLDQDHSYDSTQPIDPQIDIQPDWEPVINNDLATVESSLTALMTSERFITRISYDALTRLKESRYLYQTTGANPARLVGRQKNSFNLAGQLYSVTAYDHANKAIDSIANDTTEEKQRTIKSILYNENGQRKEVCYRNNVITKYEYGLKTYRLINLKTERTNAAPNKKLAQDIYYTYDPVGNITLITDNAQQDIYFSNRKTSPDASYEYDAIYRLIKASGREQASNLSVGREKAHSTTDSTRTNLPQPNNGDNVFRYAETYKYDSVGNIRLVTHTIYGTTNTVWNRDYKYDNASILVAGELSHRLTQTTLTIPGDTFKDDYIHDANGNMLKLHPLEVIKWNVLDQLEATSKQKLTTGGTPETTYYHYDSGGQRVRKITYLESSAGIKPNKKDERIYLGSFEFYREYVAATQTIKLERETVHIMDDKTRVLLFETKKIDTNPLLETDNTSIDKAVSRYQLGNHLGSVSLELDKEAEVISYEEYFPYGSTAYQARDKSITSVAKRYRYTGKERDEESGLYYYGARYYASWLGRWCSCDVVENINRYEYGSNNPVRFTDPDGKDILDTIKNVALFNYETTRDLVTLPMKIGAAVAIGSIEDHKKAASALVKGEVMEAVGYASGVNRYIAKPLSDKITHYKKGGADNLETAGLIVGDVSGMNTFAEGVTGETIDAKALSITERVGKIITGGAQVIGTAGAIAAPISALSAEAKMAQAVSMEAEYSAAMAGSIQAEIKTVASITNKSKSYTPNPRIRPHGKQPSPRPKGTQSHHPEQKTALKRNIANYSENKDPTLLMSTPEHQATFQAQTAQRARGAAFEGELGRREGLIEAANIMEQAGETAGTAGQVVMEHSGYLFSTTPLKDVLKYLSLGV